MGQCCSGGDSSESEHLVPDRRTSYNQSPSRYERQLVTTHSDSIPEPPSTFSARVQPKSQTNPTEDNSLSVEPFVPVGVDGVDRQIRDALDLYLQLHTKFSELNSSYAELIGPGNSKEEVRLNDALNKIYEELSSAKHAVKLCRVKKYCLSIEWDESSASTQVTAALRTFNVVNRLCQLVIDKCTPLKNSAQLLIEKEDELKRDVMVSLSVSSNQPEAWRAFNKNINQLRKVPTAVEIITKRAQVISDTLIRYAVVFA